MRRQPEPGLDAQAKAEFDELAELTRKRADLSFDSALVGGPAETHPCIPLYKALKP